MTLTTDTSLTIKSDHQVAPEDYICFLKKSFLRKIHLTEKSRSPVWKIYSFFTSRNKLWVDTEFYFYIRIPSGEKES